MRIKSYYSGTVEAALALARRELGDDALLLQARPAPPEAKHLGAHEVVFGFEAAIPPAPVEPSRHGGELFEHLVARDVHPAIAHRIEASIGKPEASQSEVRAAVAAQVPVSAPSTAPVVVFVGPPGAGKTTSLIKLAFRMKAGERRNVRIVSADSRRIGAHDQLRRLAAALGIECDVVDSLDELARTAPASQDEVVLIDNPGFSPAEASAALGWAAAIAKIPGQETALVVTATSRTADLCLAAERYRMFAPQKLIPTHFDETSTAGGILSLSALHQLPVAWIGTGASVSDGLEYGDARRIVDRVLGIPGVPAGLAMTAGGRA